ncbi:glucose-1-phosphate cytidylyltransferase [Vallitalea guaymasensis]|uniref:glucose-1-phosphate cytidylyltransferase n=1 Tax=Vallitalea guaymasensis TaxID=1185412 RepID=UPI002354F233|nr:glucose-1-phosphate cytidylyltransferase [Vallitalea guaymasensis]
MKVVILAGGLGTRISEESHLIPKPMIEIGHKPILWHIMKLYSYYGFNEFIICCGYKQHVIKQWFTNYYLYNSDVTFDFSCNNKMTIHNNVSEPWKVTLIDTGFYTMTGGRIKRIQNYVENKPFMITYGDGVSNVNIKNIIKHHKSNGKIITMTTVQPEGRFGVVDIDKNNIIKSFTEKSKSDVGWINGGYMVANPEIFNYIEGDETIFEKGPLMKLSSEGQLVAYKHNGFWQCMDTQRDKNMLEKLWQSKNAPWKVWS